MPLWLIIVLAVLAVLAVGGAVARRAQLKRTETAFRTALARANHDLAEAAAKDKGWDRAHLEAAARRVFEAEHGTEPDSLDLVEVVDLPGIDEDEAVFRALHAGHVHEITLARHGDDWVRSDPPVV
jgi:pantothenate synthetase